MRKNIYFEYFAYTEQIEESPIQSQTNIQWIILYFCHAHTKTHTHTHIKKKLKEMKM